MSLAMEIILDAFRENWKQAAKEVCSLLAIFALFTGLLVIILYAYNLPGEPAGIRSVEHQAEVVKHLVRGK